MPHSLFCDSCCGDTGIIQPIVLGLFGICGGFLVNLTALLFDLSNFLIILMVCNILYVCDKQ
jgi:hypothetical protein